LRPIQRDDRYIAIADHAFLGHEVNDARLESRFPMAPFGADTRHSRGNGSERTGHAGFVLQALTRSAQTDAIEDRPPSEVAKKVNHYVGHPRIISDAEGAPIRLSRRTALP
jgi:hypothetical protein